MINKSSVEVALNLVCNIYTENAGLTRLIIIYRDHKPYNF